MGEYIVSFKLYVCNNCKQAFFYDPKQGKSGICRNCLQKELQERSEHIIFMCPECHRHYDGSVLLDHPHQGRKKFYLELGRLLCPKDHHPLEMRNLKDDLGDLKHELLKQFSDVNKHEITEEGEFLDKVNRLKEEVLTEIHADAQSRTDQAEYINNWTSGDNLAEIAKHPSQPIPSYKDSSTLSSTSIPLTASSGVSEAKFIPPFDFASIIPSPPPFTPYTNEFWQYYYKEKNFANAMIYMGKSRAAQKIRHFLEEVGRYFCNPAKINLKIPIYEQMNSGKVIYIGDTHGSVQDTDKIIEFCVKQIELAETQGHELRIVFVGDYVDRNPHDIHNVLYIFAFAMKYPQYVRLLRGNHEEVTMNMQYGFWDNINEHLPNSYLFNDFEYLFMNLPLMHVIGINDKKIMCLHGGIPFYDQGYEEMPEIPRIMQGNDQLDSRHATIDEMDVLSQQVLWSDPVEQLPPHKYFLPNPRGVGFTFSTEVFEKWCEANGIHRVVRGHEVFIEGHREYFNNRLFSLFSNSHYVGRQIHAKILEMDFSKPWLENWEYHTIQQDLEPKADE